MAYITLNNGITTRLLDRKTFRRKSMAEDGLRSVAYNPLWKTDVWKVNVIHAFLLFKGSFVGRMHSQQKHANWRPNNSPITSALLCFTRKQASSPYSHFGETLAVDFVFPIPAEAAIKWNGLCFCCEHEEFHVRGWYWKSLLNPANTTRLTTLPYSRIDCIILPRQTTSISTCHSAFKGVKILSLSHLLKTRTCPVVAMMDPQMTSRLT